MPRKTHLKVAASPAPASAEPATATPEPCPHCDGTGLEFKPGTSHKTASRLCRHCDGSGRVQ